MGGEEQEMEGLTYKKKTNLGISLVALVKASVHTTYIATFSDSNHKNDGNGYLPKIHGQDNTMCGACFKIMQ